MYVQWLPQIIREEWGGLVPHLPMLSLSMTVCLSQSDSFYFFFWLFCLCFEKKGQKEGWHVQSMTVNRQQTTKTKRRWTVPDPLLKKNKNWCIILPVCNFFCICHGLRCLALDHWIHKSAIDVRQKGKGSPDTSSKKQNGTEIKDIPSFTTSYLGISLSIRYEPWTRQYPPSVTEW